jgi:hypothetical protein
MKRDAGLVAADPTVMTRFDVENVAGAEFYLLAIIHSHLATARDDEADMLDPTAARANDRGYVGRPSPAGRRGQ